MNILTQLAALDVIDDPNSPRQFLKLTPARRVALLAWINETFMPARRGYPRVKNTSDGLKHFFERSEHGFYIYNGAFCGAMVSAGYSPLDASEINWSFNAALRREPKPITAEEVKRQDMTAFDELTPEQQAAMIAWCKAYFDPKDRCGCGGAARWARTWSAYAPFKVTPGQMAGAFRAAGFEVVYRQGGWRPKAFLAALCWPPRTYARPDIALSSHRFVIEGVC